MNHGLPQHVTIDRKPENGCKIQNAACGRSGLMLRLKLIKGVDLSGEDDDGIEGNKHSLLHGTNALKHDLKMSFNDSRMVVGRSVHAKACHVTYDAECKHRYGILLPNQAHEWSRNDG